MKLFLGIVIFLMLAGYFYSGYAHEQAHVAINKYAGVDSHIEWNLLGMRTVPDENFASTQLIEQAYVGHGMNEAVGYQLAPLFLALMGIMIICTLYLKEEL